MLCTKCGKNEATVYFSQNVNGNKTEYNLCPLCAKEMDISSFFEKHRQYVQNNFFAPISAFGFPFESFFDFPLITHSISSLPSPSDALLQKEEIRTENPPEDKLVSLRRKLDEAVKSERYEDAAKFRDQIKELEK